MKETINLYDQDAERAVVAAVTWDDTALIQVRPILSPHDFYHEPHRVIYAACLHLQDESISRDLLTVGDELHKRKHLEKIGNRSGLAELVKDHISLAGLVHHAEIVKQFSKRRMVVKAAHTLFLQAQEHPDPEGLVLEFYNTVIQGLSRDRTNFLTMAEVMNVFMEELDQRKKGAALSGWPTGLQSLDVRIGGLKQNTLNIIAARPSTGKSALACLSALAAAKAGAWVAFFSLEMPPGDIGQRFVSISHDNLTMKALSNGTLTDVGWAEVTNTVCALSPLPIKLCDATSLTTEKIKSQARLLKMKGELDVLIIDYLGLLFLDERGVNRQEAVSRLSRELKILAKDLGISIIAISQLNRKCEDREDKRPLLADLRDSGALEQDADTVIMLYRDEKYNPESQHKGKCEILIRKNRNGPTGEFLVDWVGSNAMLKDEYQGQEGASNEWRL